MSADFWNESDETVYQKKRFKRTGKRALKRMIAERDAVLAGVQERLRVSEGRVVELEGQVREAGRRHESAQALAERLQIEVAELESLRAAQAQLEAEIARAREALREEKAASANQAARADDQARELEAALEAARHERSIAAEQASRKERERAELAEALEGVRVELGRSSGQVVRLESEIAELNARLQEAEATPPFGETMARFLDEELRAVLESSREAAAKMLETAEAESDRKTSDAHRLWESVRDEVGRYARWRAQFEPVVQSVHAQVEQLRAAVAEIPARVDAAMQPLSRAFSAADADFESLRSVLTPPELRAPKEIADPEEARADAGHLAEADSRIAPAGDEVESEGRIALAGDEVESDGRPAGTYHGVGTRPRPSITAWMEQAAR